MGLREIRELLGNKLPSSSQKKENSWTINPSMQQMTAYLSVYLLIYLSMFLIELDKIRVRKGETLMNIRSAIENNIPISSFNRGLRERYLRK